MIILAIKINSMNIKNYDQFVYTTQFYIEELKIYIRTMQELNATQQAKAIREILTNFINIKLENLSLLVK